MEDFVMSVRSVENGAFTDEVGPTQYLVVPRGQPLLPMYAIAANQWYAKVLAASAWKNQDGEARGDILFMVHGYNMNESEVIERHRLLAQDLEALQFKGAIVSYDWPSDDKALAYLSDRHKAKITALRLMSDGIRYLSAKQTPDCPINIHVMGHSTGAYVLREAFDDADDALLANGGWNVSQVIFAAGDVSSTSMAKDDGGADAIYRHCVRLTNYSSRYDVALGISNVKRAGVAPRVGRVGLPDDCPSSAVNVDCSSYYEQLDGPASIIAATDQPGGIKGVPSHSWYFGNRIFALDLFNVLIGTDRAIMKTRFSDAEGKFHLQHV